MAKQRQYTGTINTTVYRKHCLLYNSLKCPSFLYKSLVLFLFSLQTVKRPRKIQIPATSRPSRAASHSNLLDQDPPRRTRRYSDGSDNREINHYRPRARSSTPDRNGHGNTLPLMSTGYKRLPQNVAADKPIKTTLLKKKITDGKMRD